MLNRKCEVALFRLLPVILLIIFVPSLVREPGLMTIINYEHFMREKNTIIIKSIDVNKWRTTNQCFSSQACSGLDCRTCQSSIALTINEPRVLAVMN